MKWILKFRWAVLVAWIVVAVGLMLVAPPMADLVREKGQITVPDGYSSTVAADMLEEMNAQEGGTGDSQVALVFHNPEGLSEEQLAEIQAGLTELSTREDIGVTSVIEPFTTPELKEKMQSADGLTVMAAVSVAWNDREPAELRDQLNEAVAEISVEHYFTGEWLIGEDVLVSSQEGLKKTELITVGFILVILFIVFRSVVAPLIPLLTVGFSYITAQSVVGLLVEYADFPLSTFTQIFMVAVMFGIGTDYCILLISRYKEELAHYDDKVDAVIATYRSAGKTVLFAGLAVLVGFSSIGMSTFVLYKSAVAVAVGVAVLLVALVTLVPFFMAVLGKAMFWPVRGSLEHKQSKLWEWAGKASLKRPLITLLVLAAIITPLLVKYEGNLSFNSLEEIGEKYDSVKAFNIIADSFGPGEALPATIVVKSKEPIDTPEGLAVVENISREVLNVEGVSSVRSLTRPTGEPIGDFEVAEQVEQVGDGIQEGRDGLEQIRDGLAEASDSLAGSAPQLHEAASGASQLVDGTNEILVGVRELSGALTQIETGLEQGSTGAGELVAGLRQAQDSARQLREGYSELLTQYETMGSGLGELTAGYEGVAQGVAQWSQGVTAISSSLGSLVEKYPELAEDPDFQTAQGAATQLAEGVEEVENGLTQLNGQLAQVAAGMTQANDGLRQAIEGQRALVAGFDALITGLEQLRDGIDQAADGQRQVVNGLPQLEGGLEQIAGGQEEFATGFQDIGSQLGQLTSGLEQSVDGLTQIHDGLGQAQDFLGTLGTAGEGPLAGWYAPEEALADDSFQQVLNTYLSQDRKLMTIDVVLENNPYAASSLKDVEAIDAAVARALNGTVLDSAEYAISGITSTNHDLQVISADDYDRTVGWMLGGIFIILVILLRSLVMPIYLVASLILTYYTSMSVSEIIFVDILGYSGISWAVPFFAYVMLVALGIDYSIFLMDRFKEYKHLDVKEAILEAMKNMGTVIISAVVILGGTFAAMLPSGVLSLLQIATILLTGLVMYALVILPFFIPVMVRTFGRANWWPFMGGGKE